jgi:hypothetical protein
LTFVDPPLLTIWQIVGVVVEKERGLKEAEELAIRV